MGEEMTDLGSGETTTKISLWLTYKYVAPYENEML